MYGKGISLSGDILDCAVEAGIIDKAGSWFSYNGERIGQGRENIKAYLEANPDIMHKVHDQLIDTLKENEKDQEKDPKTTKEAEKKPDDMNVDEDGVIVE